jgi:hypothetical protein
VKKIEADVVEEFSQYIMKEIPRAKENDLVNQYILPQIQRTFKEVFPNIWENKEANHLFEKVPFVVLFTLLTNYTLAYCDTLSDTEDYLSLIMNKDMFYKASKVYLKGFPESFWTKEWIRRDFDSIGGRILIKNSIAQVRFNIRNKEANTLQNVTIIA